MSTNPHNNFKWVWRTLYIALALFVLTGIVSELNKPKPNNEVIHSSEKPAPHFADLFGKPMLEIAADFNQTYDAEYSRQIHAEKDGYKHFEDGGRIVGTSSLEPTGKANLVSIELPQVGSCKQEDVFNKVDDAMRLTSLDPTTKGERHEGMGGAKTGYGAYRKYKGEASAELALICDVSGTNYRLQLHTLPEYR